MLRMLTDTWGGLREHLMLRMPRRTLNLGKHSEQMDFFTDLKLYVRGRLARRFGGLPSESTPQQ